MNADTSALRVWLGQVRTCPALLGKKGGIITPATDYVCTRVVAKLVIADGVDDQLSVDAIWLEPTALAMPYEMWVAPRQWLTWPIKGGKDA